MDRMMSGSASVSSSVSGSDYRKRRVSGMDPDSSMKKRARKRASGQYVPPRTDEDLVRRLKEVRSEVFLYTGRLLMGGGRIMRSMNEDGLSGRFCRRYGRGLIPRHLVGGLGCR